MLFESALLVSLLLIGEISGHGMMLDPLNRSSLWRRVPTAPRNYQDNQVFCGGYFVQWELNGGKCGVCGDTYSDAHPQENENTGKYGTKVIAGNYTAGSVVDVEIWLTKNHLGKFVFSLCEIVDSNAPESGEECFRPLTVEGGLLAFEVTEFTPEFVKVPVQLPGENCEHCVLRWTYSAGNNWGICEDTQQWGKGCGPQETFRTCADIQIV